jgi:2-enoate reductase
LPDGIKPEDSIALANALEKEGISYFDLQVMGTFETFHFSGVPGLTRRHEKGCQLDYAEIYKKKLGIPVFTRTCSDYDPSVWEDGIEKGKADAVRCGRALLADPELPKKVLKGRVEDIRPCLLCNECNEAAFRYWQLGCSVNYGLGRGEYRVQPSLVSKKVLVIGGGPGGLEAARVAALRGHQVTLMEKETKLGGAMLVGALPIGKELFKTYIDWAERQCRMLGVKIELKKKVTVKMVEQSKPDAVIVATGATPLIPSIPNIDKSHVVTAADVLTGKMSVGEKVVVVGGGMVGCEVAEFIIEKGLAKDVTLVELLPANMLAEGMPFLDKAFLFTNIIPKVGMKIMTETHIESITDKSVMTMDKKWQKKEIEADTVVLAMGYTPNKTIYEELKNKVSELYIIGDAVKARNVMGAVHEGSYIAQGI